MNKLKRYYLSLLILILSISIAGQGSNEASLINQDIDEGNYLLALKKTKEILKKDSLNAQLWYEAGKLQQFIQKYRSAISSFQKSYNLDSTNTKTIFAIAQTCKLAGRINESIKNYEKFLVKEPENIAALTNLATIYKGGQKPVRAFVLFEKLFSLDTLNAEYLRKMARCKRAMNEILVAFDMFKKAHTIDSTNLNVVYDLTKIYTDSEMYDSTILMVDKTLKLYPDEGALYARRGSAHFRKSHYFRCVPDFEKAIELGYSSTLLIKSWGKGLYSLKRYTEAREVLNQLLVRDTLDYQVCLYMGHIHNELNNMDSAILFFNKALEIITPDEFVLSAIYRGKQGSRRHTISQ